jgi:hypothetical protein
MPPPAATPAELAARADASARHGHDPRLLWPDLDLHAYQRANVHLVDVVAQVLGRRGTAALDDAVGGPVTLGRAAFRLGVGALLGHWIAEGRVSASGTTAELFARHLEQGTRRYERMTAHAARIITELRAAGVEPVLLKGADSASLFPAPGTRAFQDVDLWIPLPRAAASDAVLLRLGFMKGRLREGRRRDWIAPDTRLASLEMNHADNPWGVDVHHGLGRIFHWALVAELPEPDPAACGQLSLGRITVPVLPPALRLANLALHASASLRLLQLQHLLDLVFAARAADDAVWSGLIALLAEQRSARFVYPSLVLVERLAPGAVSADALHEIGGLTHARLRRVAERLPLTGLSRPDRWNLIYAFMWAATPAEAMKVVWRQIVPSRYRTAKDQLQFQKRMLMNLLKGQLRYDLPRS